VGIVDASSFVGLHGIGITHQHVDNLTLQALRKPRD
jgi:hypothetical protein